ncbi:MAG: sulfite exporter TauE/SafE family protein [Eubacteriales bacterium]
MVIKMNEYLYFAVIFLSNIIQAITGFAGTMLAMPISIKLIGMNPARIALNAVATAASIYIVAKDYKQVNLKMLKRALLWMTVGTLISMIVYRTINTTILLYLYGVVIIGIALHKLFIKNQVSIKPYFMNIILILAGILQGLFASGGPFLVIYLVSNIKDKHEFRATVSAIWIVLGAVFAIQNMEYTTISDVRISSLSMIPLVLGVILGDQIHRKIPQEKFMKMTYVLLLISGFSVYI